MLSTLLCCAALAPIANFADFGPQNSAKQAWKRYDMKSVRASAELPVKPEPFAYDINQTTDRVQTSEWMAARLDESFLIFSYSVYKPGNGVDLKEAAKGAIETLIVNLGLKSIKSSTKEIKVGNVPAVKVHAVYDMKGDKTVYSTIIAGKNRTMWQVIANYPSHPQTSKTVERVLESWRVQNGN